MANMRVWTWFGVKANPKGWYVVGVVFYYAAYSLPYHFAYMATLAPLWAYVDDYGAWGMLLVLCCLFATLVLVFFWFLIICTAGALGLLLLVLMLAFDVLFVIIIILFDALVILPSLAFEVLVWLAFVFALPTLVLFAAKVFTNEAEVEDKRPIDT